MRPNAQRNQGDPRLVHTRTSADLNTTRLNRRPLASTDIDEGWLQTLLNQHPDLLAVDEIAPDYSPLIPIGREIAAGAGRIDNLFINPSGQITIVEAKLWKNPEARRSVVGQILEYANHVAAWSYDELNARCIAHTRRSLHDHVRYEHGDQPMLSEPKFVDAVTRNLQRGRFLLLVVGDGIREDAVDLMGVLQGSPGLRFTLALLELRLYAMPDNDDLLVVPTIVARTQEIARTVIDIRGDHNGYHVSTHNATPALASAPERRPANPDALTLDDFVTIIRALGGPEAAGDAHQLFGELERRGLTLELTHANLLVKLPDPNGSGKTFTLFGISRDGYLWVQHLPGQTIAAGIEYSGSPAETFLNTLTDVLGRELRQQRGRPAPDYWGKNILFTDARPHIGAILAALDEYLVGVGADPTQKQ